VHLVSDVAGDLGEELVELETALRAEAAGQRTIQPPFKPRPKDEELDVPDLEIPDFPLDPDSKPAVVPSAAEPPTAYIVTDDLVGDAQNDRRVKRLVNSLKDRIKNLTVRVVPLDQAREIAPGLDKSKLPAVVVTEDGQVTDQITSDSLPAEDLFSILMWLLGGASVPVPWIAFAGVATWALIRWQDWRAKNGRTIFFPRLAARLKALEDMLLPKEPPKA
jgi:hypothetical protein